MGLHVLGCRVDILGTNCNKLLKLKMSGEGGRPGGGGGVGGGVINSVLLNLYVFGFVPR